MTLQQKKDILLRIGLGLALGLLLMASFAAVGYPRERGRAEIALPTHYPKQFSGIGRIDRITRNEIVIDDSLYRLAPHVTYHIPTRKNASSAWFRANESVGFVTNAKGEVIALYLIE